MKKIKNIWFIAPALILFVLVSCQDPFLSAPQFQSGGATTGRGGIRAPEGVWASQGEKRSVTLTWNKDPNADYYYIYNADTPLDQFERCGETSSTQFKFTVPPGSTKYYSVSSVSYNGTESARSFYARGTSLAQPLISDITDITESSASVTWYMDNEDSYKDNLLYTVYCYNGNGQVDQIALDGSKIKENRAVFTGLAPNTNYEYQVEAYLNGEQNAVEKSEKMNKATARRFRPGAPREFKASRGAVRDKITLSFELPDMVDIALGENQYDPKPLYFEISKRIYSESGNNEYMPVCKYFGSIPGKGAQFAGGYIPGAKVTWTDQDVKRGEKYQYRVKSYVDDTQKKIYSDDASDPSDTGWALSDGTLSFGKIEYTLGNGFNESATLSLNFVFDAKDETYEYNLVEKIEPLGDSDPLDPVKNIERKKSFNTYNAVRDHVPSMDLTKKTTEENPGRGLYSYAVEIRQNNVLLDTISTIGKKEISENTEPIIVNNFIVQDGYKDKFVLKWENYSNRKYTLYTVNADGSNPVEIGSVNNTPSGDANMTVDKNFSYTYTGVTAGITRYFAIRPSRIFEGGSLKYGQMVYAGTASMTLGVPELSLSGDYSYNAVTVAWTEAQKADTYRVKYRYSGETAYTTKATVSKKDLTVDASGKYRYALKPEGDNIDIAKAGKEIQIQVDALNEGLRAQVGGGEISTTSAQDVKTRLVGPAELGLSATRAVSAHEIDVSWNKITGADGYYVFRRKFNMYNTAEEGTETVAYYVPAVETSTINITGKDMALDSNNTKIDTLAGGVKATASFANPRYTLKDIYMPDGEYEGNMYKGLIPAYRNQQNDMIRGNPYRYWVIPVINGTEISSIDFVYSRDSANKNTDIAYYTIQENSSNIKYSGADVVEKNNGTGFTFGLGHDVTASKGTYSSNGRDNDGIKITWSPPPLLVLVPGFTPKYTLYRRYAINEGTWSAWTDISNISASQYIDVQDPDVNYQYIVGITNGSSSSDPRVSSRFVNESYGKLDEKGRPKMVGFMLGKTKLVSVSRDARSDGQGSFGELVTWSREGLSVDGYTVYLLNRNVNNNRQWIECDSVSGDKLSVLIANTGNRLKVLRDYKHYYKVRGYMVNDAGAKIYGPDPMPNYTWSTDPDPYVKWGARQVSADEFAAITALSIGTGMNWAGNQTSDVPDRRGDHNVSFTESNTAGYNRDINFNNSKPYFVTISGHLYGYCTATLMTPTEYGADCAGAFGALSGAKDHLSTLTFTGPGDVNGMYSGTVKILRMGSGAGTGPYKVTYNGQTDYAVGNQHYRECFTFATGSKNYKRTRNFDWSPSTGISETKNIGPNMEDKWWYPVDGTRAGWD